ncbi:hypothetical protein SDC9_165348 [bioreactor metagenome]|uniref:Protein kinase domain-containing protein n=1 Tax=bioreactor metagenome TaxID=1076179 RepID=A0A645FWE1_9ZZZZ
MPNRLFYLPHVAPEVLRTGNVSVQTDIYQAGITAFRLLNGFGKIHDRFNSLGQAGFNRLIQQGKVIQSGDFFPFIPQSLKRVVKKAVHVDPASRFQSALEMRRALERLGYPGYWTCDSTGRFVGHNASYEFRFEAQPKGAGLFDFTAFKKNKATGRETRVGEYSTKNVLRRQSDELKRNFMQRVVTG